MSANTRFRLIDLVILAVIAMMFGAVIMPAVFCSAGRSRESVCRNNLKLIGTGLELWKQHAGRYPFYDYPSGQDLQPWPDILVMQGGYTSQRLQGMSTILQYNFHLTPEDFIKTVDDDKIFMCPSDRPHPHRINEGRSFAWGFWRSGEEDGYEYSYAIAMYTMYGKYHQRADQQVLVPDGLWDFTINLSGAWVTDPNAYFSTPNWYSNTVGYWHKRNSANFLFRDLHIENHTYPPDTNKVFYLNPGEDINGYNVGDH
jgi:hypothetical protein